MCQVMTADRYKLICPRTAGHVHSQGLCELEEKSPKERKKLLLFCLEKPPPVSGAVLEVAMTPALQAPSSWGRGMPRCSELAAPRFMWKHSKLLSF